MDSEYKLWRHRGALIMQNWDAYLVAEALIIARWSRAGYAADAA
jgi:hypothetical protein